MSNSTPRKPPLPDWLELVEKQVASIKHGAIQLIVHESKVVQIETTEKVRFDKPDNKSRPH